MAEEKLQRLLTRHGTGSRRKCEELIRKGRVRVNGRPETAPETKVDPERDHVSVDGKRLRPVREAGAGTYLIYYKPRGVVSTMSDPQGRPCLGDLARKTGRRFFPAGRLDYNSEGLIILTDDGELVQRITHPRFGCRKTYQVKVRGKAEERQLSRIRAGMRLDGRQTHPVEVKPLPGKSKNSWYEVTLTEGRKNQIRRMFELIGHPVLRLRRLSIGGVRADGLKPGDFRLLSQAEIRLLTSKAPRRTGTPVRPQGYRSRAAAREGTGSAGRGRSPSRRRPRRSSAGGRQGR